MADFGDGRRENATVCEYLIDFVYKCVTTYRFRFTTTSYR